MSNSRTINTRRNLMSGVVKQILGILLPFVTRTIVLYTLGAEYQGLNSLFKSILHVLSMADVGFSTAVIYMLYKPIANNDNEAICAIMAYLKHVYFIVGVIITGLGLVIMPLLPALISGEYPSSINIYVLYIMYLFNTSISYCLFSYKSALITAMQRDDIISNIYSIVSVLLNLAQIFILLFMSNYYLYVLALPITTILNNLLMQYISKKKFPEIVPRGKLSKQTRSELSRQLKGIVINKIGDVTRNGFDTVFISVLLGLTAVAVYDNYYYIYTALYGFSLMITHAIQASVGNSIATESTNKNYKDLCKFNFIFTWFSSWCTICMACLYQPFMSIWMNGNPSMMLSDRDMLLFCFYFFAITMNNVRNMYVSGSGLFWELRVWYVLESIGNAVLNLVLGNLWGITGIIIATLITIILFNYVARTNVLFKEYFKISPAQFYKEHFIYFIVMVIACVVTYVLCNIVDVAGILGLFVRFLLCVFVPNIIFVVMYHKNQYYDSCMKIFKRLIFKH